MKFYKENLVQREHYFAIVDEVDSILIDEARTPLIISGPTQVTTGMYTQLNQLVPKLKRSTAEEGEVDDGHYTLDEKSRSVTLTDEGVAHVEQLLGLDNLYDPANISFQHHLLQALKAHRLFKKDVDYVVKDGQVVIVDEFTGRLMPGRRYSDGLHQALEAKENVKVAAENQTYASITFQNYFRMYDKLAGMTGTADTEAVEFREIYGLDVAAIPTHRPMVRTDFPDAIYRGQNEKHQAIVNDIAQLHKDGQPVLVGTISIEKSEMLSKMLTKKRVPHNVLNAKNHGKEAEIIAEAGHKGKVTIATNMAGRGTDIKLGEGVIDLGGLHILGTERHESRRIDNQLRGRAGRQGDPGSSRFYLALDDDLLRLFGSDRVAGLMSRLGMEEGQAIENKLVSRAIEGAQRRVENQHFDVRKQLLDYDNVMSQQREVVYDLRRDIMIKPDLTELLDEYIEDLLDEIYFNAPENFDKMDEEERHALIVRLDEVFALSRVLNLEGTVPLQDQAKEKVEEIFAILKGDAEKHYMEIVRYFMLEALDRNWKDHLLQMDQLREGIGLRGYGQRDPKQEYKREGFRIFQEMLYTTKENAMKHLCRLKVQKDRAETQEFKHKEQPANLNYAAGRGQAGKKKAPVKRAEPKVGRNDPCPCGSGKKFKKCCGAGQ
ncbi:MAG: preprotein translocase subunit SecA [Desulfovibrio sp.]|nr:MAG: preprotein translocase subunit SecA [Desulfovibrio sp.]